MKLKKSPRAHGFAGKNLHKGCIGSLGSSAIAAVQCRPGRHLQHQSLALPLKITMPFFLNFLGASAPAEAEAESADADGAGLRADEVAGASALAGLRADEVAGASALAGLRAEDVAGVSPAAEAGLLAEDVAGVSPAVSAFLAGALRVMPASLASWSTTETFLAAGFASPAAEAPDVFPEPAPFPEAPDPLLPLSAALAAASAATLAGS